MQSEIDIEGVDEAYKILAPHWDEIESEFERHSDEFHALWSASHDEIGRILKAHLVLENYLNSYIECHYDIEEFQSIRLSFYQKALLLPRSDFKARYLKAAILQVNAVRNKFGHRLNHKIDPNEIDEIYKVLKVARKGISYSKPLEAIEAFVPIACTFLTVSPPHIEEIFEQANSKIQLKFPDTA